MDNLKIVIDHLQDCIDYMDRDRKRHWVFVRGNVVRAAFQLLKAQEPVKWVKISPAGIYECSGCGQNVMTSDIDAYKYCHGCGRAVKWDD